MVARKLQTNGLGLGSLELLPGEKFLLLPLGHKVEESRIRYQTKNFVAIELVVENNLAFALLGFFHFNSC